MTVGDLLAQLKNYDPAMTVRYKYDGGHAHPTFVRVYVKTEHVGRPDYKEETFVCLDEDGED